MKTVLKSVIAATALALASGAALAQAPIVIKFSHVVAPEAPKGQGAEKFMEFPENIRRISRQGASLCPRR